MHVHLPHPFSAAATVVASIFIALGCGSSRTLADTSATPPDVQPETGTDLGSDTPDLGTDLGFDVPEMGTDLIIDVQDSGGTDLGFDVPEMGTDLMVDVQDSGGTDLGSDLVDAGCQEEKINFTPANEPMFELYEVCIPGGDGEAAAAVQEIDPGMSCGFGGFFAKCGEGEVSCNGPLETGPDKVVTEEQWKKICLLSILDAVTKIGGGHYL